MVTSLLIITFLLVLISFATYRWLLPKSNNSNDNILPPSPDFKGLFAPDEKALAEMEKAETEARKETEKEAILSRANENDKEALIEAWKLGEPEFYNKVLDVFVGNAKTDEAILSLASFVGKENSLRSNVNLARQCLRIFQANPTKFLLGEMLHVVALSDDAALYQEAFETAIKLWQEEKLTGVKAEEISEIAESEFWVLSQQARTSGAGFLLKQKLADVRRKQSKK